MEQALNLAITIVSVILILFVVMQPSKSNAASMLTGADDGQPKTKARGFEAFLIKATTVISIVFFALLLALAYLSAH